MALNFGEWTAFDEPFALINVTSQTGWDKIRSDYAAAHDRPLERVIEIAKAHGVVTVLVEYRYIDADWRSEHAHFYGSTFKRYPSVCHRLHFFADEVPADFDELDEFQDFYRGYSIMRPLPMTPVGRTMLSPPPEMVAATVTKATEHVHVFGSELSVTGMPFISQDSRYLRCAHASMWMLLRHAHLRHNLPRRLPSEIRNASLGGMVIGRQMPSEGLSVAQMLDGLDRLGMPTGRLEPAEDKGAKHVPLPGSVSLHGVVCRYINSDLPPIVVSNKHAWAVIGWARKRSEGHGAITLWRHDDARGPYMEVRNPWKEEEDEHDPWRFLLVPLMPKMNLGAERAESTGAAWFKRLVEEWAERPDGAGARTVQALRANELTWRTFAVSSSEYKARLRLRTIDPNLRRMYERAQWPKYIWVIEAVDRIARDASRPDVLGEVILDSTDASPEELELTEVLAGHVERAAFVYEPDTQELTMTELDQGGNYLGDHIAR